jgi:hypothetical protein
VAAGEDVTRRYLARRAWHAVKRTVARLDPPSRSVLTMARVMREVAAQRWPYSFDGGHAPVPGPSLGESGVGYDCSGVIRYVLYRAGVIKAQPNVNTESLPRYLARGQGAYITIWIRNSPTAQHAVIETHNLGLPRFFEAGHTGMIVGFLKSSFDTTNYTAYRRP